ncbi:GlsB/YeaQ/YmgE family stress response membrane protein [Caenimonas sedimenti]|uniref:GlsB/YeaQ/YmgE family stress response membrane protein n=1 Tax=Caenimonas sedimenti TaxID=2596921 RepID=A0A562ZRL2_9BURK|nr:GlsB/YeaQ/YmgE family stress response membrane protein [Caenimonas sedimenti]TWO70958.1 GlsB/YeaQ/YmgE family stress response membrane protein [Caenimonas sedimenti]
MGIITTIVIGFIVGLLARALKPGNDSMGIILTTLVGIAGSFIARYAGVALGIYNEGDPIGWIASILGAMVLLLVISLFRGRAR